MNIDNKTNDRLFLAYLALGLVTYGVAFNLDHTGNFDEIRALFCAWLWPLYWSAKAFSFLRV